MQIHQIIISDHPVSLMYQQVVRKSWTKNKLKVEKFEAVTPKDLPFRDELNFGKKLTGRKHRAFTDTEKAVWYSHYDLWKKCAQSKESFIIIEHDSLLVKPLPNLKRDNHKFLSFVKRKNDHVMSPGSGYYITPKIAKERLIDTIPKSISHNSDGHLFQQLSGLRQMELKDFSYVEQVNIDGINTIDHKTDKRVFVGDNHEDFDLSSLHREAQKAI